jgi:hypothetical protein
MRVGVEFGPVLAVLETPDELVIRSNPAIQCAVEVAAEVVRLGMT